MKKTILAVIVLLLIYLSPVQAQDVNSLRATIKPMQPFYYICYEYVGPYSDFPKVEEAFMRDFRQTGIQPIGHEIALYWNSPMVVKPEALRYDIGYPVAPNTKGSGTMYVKLYNYHRAASTIHRGSYQTTYKTLEALYQWIARNDLNIIGGPAMEVYLDDNPNAVPDHQKQTEILIPIE